MLNFDKYNDTKVVSFIEKHKALFWHIPPNEKASISLNVLIEYIFNYGDLEAVRELFSIIGKERAAEIFAGAAFKTRQNFFPEVKNFFHVYFLRHVSAYPYGATAPVAAGIKTI